jgi:hypothetical protein
MADVVTNYLDSVNWAGLGYVGFIILLITGATIICFILGWLIYDYWRHKIKVVVIEKMGGSFNISLDRGREYLNKKTSETKFHLYKAGIDEKPPTKEFFGVYKLKKKALMLFKAEEGAYSPLKIQEAEKMLSVEEHARRKWHILKQKEALEQYKKQNFWEKYGSIIAFGITLCFCFTLVILTLNHIKDVASSIHELAAAMPGKAQIIEGIKGTP